MARTYKEYRSLLQSILPKGAFWTRAKTADLTQLLNGLGEVLSRIEQRSQDLQLEAFSNTITETLEEWETDFDIPSPGFKLETTIEGRRSAIAVRKIAVGQQDAGYFIELATTLGWTITITEFPKSLIGLIPIGDSILTDDLSTFYWMINVWVSDHNNANITQLMNELRLRAPAHSHILFRFYNVAYSNAYSSAYNAAPWWDGSWWPLSYDRSYSIAYANNSDYDGTRLIGAYSQAYSVSYDAHNGGAYDFDAYSSAYSKPAYGSIKSAGAYSKAYSRDYNSIK